MVLLEMLACKAEEAQADEAGWELWYVEFDFVEGDDAITETANNFSEYVEPDEEPQEDTGWTDEYAYDDSAGGYFLEILPAADGAAMAVYGGEILVGSYAAGIGELSWTYRDTQTETLAFGDEYAFESELTDMWVRTLELRVDGDGLTGSDGWSYTEQSVYRETDEWDGETVDDYSGRVYVESGDGDYLYNDADLDDCRGDECELTTTYTYDYSYDLVGVRYEGDPEDILIYVGNSNGNPYG